MFYFFYFFIPILIVCMIGAAYMAPGGKYRLSASGKVLLKIVAWTSIPYFAILALNLFGLVWTWQDSHIKYSKCAILPNGLMLVPEAVYNFAYSDNWKSTIFVKKNDGTILSIGAVRSLKYSQTTTYWTDFLQYPGTSERLAYHPSSGLVMKSRNPDLYNKIVENAGPLLGKDQSKFTPVRKVWLDLKDHPKYGSSNCGDIPSIAFRPTRPEM